MSDIYKSAEGERVLRERYLAYLDRWPVPADRLRVPTRRGETFVMASGPEDAPPLVLLHGSGANAAMWMADVPVWAQHFRVLAVDMIGEPGLSAPSRAPLNSDAHALWLDNVLEALGVRRAAFAGTSLGGWLALDYAIRRPERVERLALQCPGGIGRQKYGLLLASVLLLPFGQWGRRLTMNRALGTASTGATPEDRERGEYVMLVHRNFRPRMEKLPVFGDDALRRLTMPMLVVLGGRDALLDSQDTRRRLQQAVPHARISFFPEVGHLITEQTQPILEFLLAREEAASND
ncbi:alpha/beta fold hydrolase [Microtetraspora malaysiensis]|uniref:alpha/beta fold hydrolase n=1 Tax=Microtetraspora malaysiensis TaxID=161358 RepID=UPI003D89D69D